MAEDLPDLVTGGIDTSIGLIAKYGTDAAEGSKLADLATSAKIAEKRAKVVKGTGLLLQGEAALAPKPGQPGFIGPVAPGEAPSGDDRNDGAYNDLPPGHRR